MKYLIGAIIYIILAAIVLYINYINSSPNRMKVSDEEYMEFLQDMEKQEATKKKR